MVTGHFEPFDLIKIRHNIRTQVHVRNDIQFCETVNPIHGLYCMDALENQSSFCNILDSHFKMKSLGQRPLLDDLCRVTSNGSGELKTGLININWERHMSKGAQEWLNSE